MNQNDIQIGGNHYQKHKVQHWDIMLACQANYFQSAITKYLDRYKDKNGREDLEKARHFALKYIGEEYPPFLTPRVIELWAMPLIERAGGLQSTCGKAIEAIILNNSKRAAQLISQLIKEEYGDANTNNL